MITCNVTTSLHIFLNVMKSREQVHSSVGVDTRNDHWPRPREGREHMWPISYDQPCSCAGNTLSEIILYTYSVSVYTVHSIMPALLQSAIFHIIILNVFYFLRIYRLRNYFYNALLLFLHCTLYKCNLIISQTLNCVNATNRKGS